MIEHLGQQQMNDIGLRVVESPADVHRAFARWLADFIRDRAPEELTRLILPVGPTAGYPLLADICNRERISWHQVCLVTMDEYLDWRGRPLSLEHPLSFTGFMRRFIASLDDELRPAPGAYVWPDPFDIDRVPRYLDEIGGVDACLGGIGVHGHIAFNEPPNARFVRISAEEFKDSPTRVVALAPETIVMNATRSNGGRFDDFPPLAVTVGMREILSAARIRLFCDGGAWQQEAVARAVSGEQGLDYPVTLLQGHGDVEITADAVTAARATEHTDARS